MRMPRDWNAASYHKVSTPHQDWGLAVLERVELRGDETVLDAGCGTGRITQMLLDRLPRGRVVAVDGSQAMVDRAREQLDDRATVLRADLVQLTLDEPVDAAISTAAFHWIADHDALFARLHEALKPGGQFVFQCGGAGNIDAVVDVLEIVGAEEAFAPHVAGWPGPWNHATPEETEERLKCAGFDVERCWLQEWPVTLDQPREFLETVVLGAHLDRLPDQLREPYVDRVLEELPGDPLELHYVRLNADARRRA